MEELIEIQKRLKAPKNQRNNFGKYNYRSCEDILEAVKPLANELGCAVTLSDTINIIGERVYVCATAKLIKPNTANIEVTAYAREPLNQKGMNEAQITGSASSYARKYALNGLFAIDDTKDSDTNEYPKQTNKTYKDCKTKAELKTFYSALSKSEQANVKTLVTEFALTLKN